MSSIAPVAKRDIHQTITDRIIASIEAGTAPWMKPWSSAKPATRPLRSTGQPCNGVNVLTLWLDAEEKGYSSPYWFGFQTALKLGACVRKGEKGSAIVYANKLVKTEENPSTGEEETKAIPFLKQSYVFNAAQIDGLPEHFYQRAEPVEKPATGPRVSRWDAFFDRTGVDTSATAVPERSTGLTLISCRCPTLKTSTPEKAITPPSRMK